MKDVVFLIHTGDKSEWSWKYYNYYYQKYFTCDYLMDTVFLTENKKVDFKDMQSVQTGNVPWADGLINYLKSVNYKYVIYQHEDYFLTEITNHNVAEKLINICKDQDLQLLKCCGWWAGFIDENVPMEKKTDDLWLFNNNSPYLVSHQTSIWNKDFLLSTLIPGMNPWEHEINGTIELRKRNIPLYAYREKSPFEYSETLVHGKIRPGAKHLFEINLED